MKKIIILLLFLFYIATIGCNKNEQPKKLLVLAGAGLIKPMTELINHFEKSHNCTIDVHYGGSAELFGILATTGGDIFIPGAKKYTVDAIKKGYVEPKSVKKLVLHIPIIATPAKNNKITSFEDFGKKNFLSTLNLFLKRL